MECESVSYLLCREGRREGEKEGFEEKKEKLWLFVSIFFSFLFKYAFFCQEILENGDEMARSVLDGMVIKIVVGSSTKVRAVYLLSMA